jgi:hypothetical protein
VVLETFFYIGGMALAYWTPHATSSPGEQRTCL